MPRKQRFKPSRKPKPALVQEDIAQVRGQPSDETGKATISMEQHGNAAERQESTSTPKRESGAEG